jgi:DNA repair protein RAD16
MIPPAERLSPHFRWNPAVEFQAMDRIHRLGQFKPIKVVRFVVEGTIEDR